MIRTWFSSARNVGGMVLSVAMMAGYVYYSQHEILRSLPKSAPRPVPQALETAVNDLCRDVSSGLPEPDRALKPTVLLPLNGDREGLVTDQLRAALDRQGWYRPMEAGLLEKVFSTARELTGISLDQPARSRQWTPAELANLMRSSKAETVICGNVDRLAIPTDGPVEIELRLELWELSASDPNTAELRQSLDFEHPKPAAVDVAPSAGRESGLRTYGIVLLLALIWPFATIPWMKKAIREDNNAAVLKTLLGMTAIPLFVFLLYLFFLGKGSFDIVMQGGIGALFLFFYSAFVMNGIHDKIR